MLHLAIGTNSESCTLSLTGTSRPSSVTAATSASRPRSSASCAGSSNVAALKFVGNPTWSTLAGSSGGRKAWGSGLHSVTRPGSKPLQTDASSNAASRSASASAGTRRRYGGGGMFMIDRHGTRAAATRPTSSRTAPSEYCGSCIASATRS